MKTREKVGLALALSLGVLYVKAVVSVKGAAAC